MSTILPSAPVYPRAFRIDPGDAPARGTVRLPGSKSITNRALLVAGLARGETIVENALFCDDSIYLAGALQKLGVAVRTDEEGPRFTVLGAGGAFQVKQGEFFLGNAGTSTRFLTGALAFSGGSYVVDGDERMRQRPIGDLVRALRELGAVIDAPSGCPPVFIGQTGRIGGLSTDGAGRAPAGLDGGLVTVPGRTSSQFISAILLAAPLARRDVEVLVEGVFVSRPYVDVTLQVMRSFGADAWADDGRADGRTAFYVKAGRGYRGREYWVEGDASTASYFMAAAAIGQGTVRVEGIGKESIQGDARFADVLAKMGAHVKKDSEAITVTGAQLKGVDEDCSDIPDIVPTLATVALFARGRTRIANVGHLRFKESDRLASVESEIRKLGGKIRVINDGLEIEESPLHGGEIDPWGDHRLAMSMSLAGLVVPGIVVRNPHVVAKSFPGYFEALRSLGVRVRPLEEVPSGSAPAGAAPGAAPGAGQGPAPGQGPRRR